jgi:signal peptidase
LECPSRAVLQLAQRHPILPASQLLFQALNFLTVVSSGLMMWKGLCLITNSESPIVVVLSSVSPFGVSAERSAVSHAGSQINADVWCRGSMEPAFYRGDILFLTNPADVAYEVGDITVYKV